MSVRVHQPESADEAVERAGELGDAAKIMAGGTALMIMLKNGLIEPEHIIWLGRVAELSEIRKVDRHLHMGGLVTLRQLAASPSARQTVPCMAGAAGLVANRRIRTVATVGGNLAEADYASDPPCVLVAHDAEVQLRSVSGTRWLSVGDFLVDYFETAAEPTEIVTAVRIPVPSTTSRSIYLKYLTRTDEDRPCVGVAATMDRDGSGVCRRLRIAVGAATATPIRLPHVEDSAEGRPLSRDDFAAVAAEYARAAEPLSDLRGSAAYRKQAIRVLVRRALEELDLNHHGAVKL